MIQQADHQSSTTDSISDLLQSNIELKQPALNLITKFCQALADEEITYCHWKSNNALDRSGSGDNDLDLLVSRADISRFTEIVYRFGFKQAKAPVDKQMNSVLNYYGYDEESDKWVHVHAHYQLIMGHDMTKNFRLAIEEPYLESATWDGLFKVPAAEFEFIVFVIRMVLKHSTWDAIITREGKLKASERKELTDLQHDINQNRVHELLKSHLPYISADLFNDCVKALQPGSSIWTRVKAAQQLQTSLQANSLYSPPIDTFLKVWRRAELIVRRRVFKTTSKYSLEAGGAMIAILGGDGAGKSTAVDALYAWLSKKFETTRVHMGKPAWSWTTIAVRSILKVGQLIRFYPLEATFDETIRQKSFISSGYPYLIREVCRARDRYWTYIKARRFAARGGLVLLDRFPLPQVQIMDGLQAERFVRELRAGPQAKQFLAPHLRSRLTKFLIKLEEKYYRQVVLPELLVVLRVDPKIAVQRKTDENPTSVQIRSSEIWNLNWEHTNAYTIDASKSKMDVLTELKSLIWSKL
jgi:thymidylate kinase